ncbi:MAG: hemolysin family protein [Proteobacteria bacterium]|nr:hemolysin family protein [Pseudomonadota bacterium]
MSYLNEILIIFVCLLFSAFFSMSETAFLRLRLAAVESEARAGKATSVVIRQVLSSMSRFLSSILIGNNLVNVAASAVASSLFVSLWGEKLGVLAATGIMTAVILIFCEITPKTLAANNPERYSSLLALPLYAVQGLLWPISKFVELITAPLIKILGGREAMEQAVSEEEIIRLVRVGARTGSIEKYPAVIVGAALQASKTTVADVMVPRAEIFSVSENADPEQILNQMMEERYTRVPVYRGDLDHVVGVVHLKDVIAISRGVLKGTHRDIIRPVLRVPAGKKTLELLREMQISFSHMAIVKDEFGATIGLVTAEDILEEIVGEIRDEFDQEELEAIQKEPDGHYLVLARMKVVDFNRQTGQGLQHPQMGKGQTLGGLFINLLGRTAHKGDLVSVGDYKLEAVEVSGIRIVRIRVLPPPEAPAEKVEKGITRRE